MNEEQQVAEATEQLDTPTDAAASEQESTPTEPEVKVDNGADAPSLEDHLAQFEAMANVEDQSAEPAKQTSADGTPETPEVPAADVTALEMKVEELYAEASANREKTTREDLNRAVDTIKAESPILKGMPDEMVRGWLEEMARIEPRISKAFVMRNRDTKLWSDTLTAIGKQMTGKLGTLPDSDATGAVSSIRASVNSQQGGSDAGPTDKEIAAMSPGEFERYKREQGFDSTF